MRSVNKVILIGNLTRDPEMRQTQSNQPVTTFSIATNRVWVTKDGSQQSSTEYHDLVAWSRLAEICFKYLKKSKLVYVEGYLKTRSWDSSEGIRKFKTEVVVQDMIMLEKRPRGESEEVDMIPMDENAPLEEAATAVISQVATNSESMDIMGEKSAINRTEAEIGEFGAEVEQANEDAKKAVPENPSDESSVF